MADHTAAGGATGRSAGVTDRALMTNKSSSAKRSRQ